MIQLSGVEAGPYPPSGSIRADQIVDLTYPACIDVTNTLRSGDLVRRRALADWARLEYIDEAGRYQAVSGTREVIHGLLVQPAKDTYVAWKASRPDSSVSIIEYLCFACGEHAIDSTMLESPRRTWLCCCGVRWTGGPVESPYVMQPLEDRI